MNERIFYLSGNESLEELKDFLEQCSADALFFLFPRKSWIFHQNTDLQALRDLADEKGKILTFVTQNALARTRIQAVGIDVLASLEDREQTPFEKMRAQKESGFSTQKISHIPIETLKNAIAKKQPSSEETEDLKLKISRPVLHALLLLGVFLLGFFLFLLKVAIPDAMVEIEPFQKEEEMHINVHMLSASVFTETDLWRENNGVFAYPIEEVYEIEKTFSHVTQEFQGKNSEGRMKISNSLPEALTFRKGTRMENTAGVTFVTQKWITIPAAKGEENGEITISVEAAERNRYHTFQGEKANMPKGQKFIFPGLSSENQTKVTAENVTEMKGGETKWVYKLSKDDIEKAKGQLIEAARKQKKKEFEYGLSQKFLPEKNMEFLPLSGKQFESEILSITFESPEEELIGQDRSEFSGKIRARIKNYAYSRDDVFALIREKFSQNAPDGMELMSVNNRVLTPEVLYVYDENTRIKVSFSTRGVYQYIIEPKSKKGLLFAQKIKTEIAGKNKDEAKDLLVNNFKEISDVHISLWPFWVTSLPTLPEKIQLETAERENNE